MKNKILAFLVVLMAVVFAASIVAADPTGTNVTEGTSSRGTGTTSPDSVDAQAGNVTELTVNTTKITQYWQGYFGEINGQIILSDSSGNNLYDWSISSPSGEVYASRDGSVTWASIACANSTHVSAEETALNITAGATDNISNTFSKSTHDAFDVGATSFNADNCSYTTNAYDAAGAQATYWDEILLYEGSAIVYTTIINADQTGFDSSTHDFEMLVGEDGKDSGTTTYYFYTEII